MMDISVFIRCYLVAVSILWAQLHLLSWPICICTSRSIFGLWSSSSSVFSLQRIQMGHVDISVFSLRAWDLGLTGGPALTPAARACVCCSCRPAPRRPHEKAGWCLVRSCSGTGRWRLLNGNRGMFWREGWAMLLWDLAEWLVPHLSPTLQMTCSIMIGSKSGW